MLSGHPAGRNGQCATTLPIEVVLSRLENQGLRVNGRDRWRACCPAHNGSNPSALSIGVGNDDRVLLRCWQGCTVDQIAVALGLELSDLFPPRSAGAGDGHAPLKRRRLIAPSQALEILDNEMTLAVVCASDMAQGKGLDEKTRQRLMQGAARVSLLRDEVRA